MRNILYYLSAVQISPDVQNKIHNLQFRLEQFTEQKKAKKYQLVGIAHAINNNTKSPQT